MPVTQKDIEEGLKELGLARGDTVIVHSSLSSFGRVKGGADAVVDAILDVIGSEGTLVVPTFNYGLKPFDRAKTPSMTGRITEAVRLRSEAVRSLHPTHSVAAIGADAQKITEGHENVDAFGEGSPLHKILEMNGKILQIGVTHTSDSMIHVAEELARVPYLSREAAVTVALPGRETGQRIIRRPGCSRGFDKIDDSLQETGQVQSRMIGDSLVRLMPASTVVAAAVEMLSEDPGALLCDIGDCQTCAEARAMITAAQASQEEEEWLHGFEVEEQMSAEGEEADQGLFDLLVLDNIPDEEKRNEQDYPY